MVDLFGYFFWSVVIVLRFAAYLLIPAAFVGGVYLGLRL